MGAYELVAETKPTTTEETPFINGELTVNFDTITAAGDTTVTVLPGIVVVSGLIYQPE